MSLEVVIKGAKELEKAFDDVATKVDPATAKGLRLVAKPVKATVEDLSRQTIADGPWAKARIGRKKLGVYIVEKERSRGPAEGKRSNLSGLLMTRAYLPALKRHEGQILHGLNEVLEELTRSVD